MWFQPFLRFYLVEVKHWTHEYGLEEFQPFLRFYGGYGVPLQGCVVAFGVSTLLEILPLMWSVLVGF